MADRWQDEVQADNPLARVVAWEDREEQFQARVDDLRSRQAWVKQARAFNQSAEWQGVGLVLINQLREEWGRKLEDQAVRDWGDIMVAKGVMHGIALFVNNLIEMAEDKTDYDAEIQSVKGEMEDERRQFAQGA